MTDKKTDAVGPSLLPTEKAKTEEPWDHTTWHTLSMAW